ncbi:PREDICTED: uncharacterized protein LOC109462252 [Branchiostoma belcheri]|uniref:Uncharacterized protein LOC109462252 n=1 Tax=Branchiostoma belcheri TaxID=7741 RepID=A0A6P4Y6J0_BRABE|nr:PREDICTED: uncharacterized protein LOC109462252 [Branchiostoma belcheri]
MGQAEMGEGQTEIGDGITEADENEADEVTGICTDGSGNVLLVRSGGAVDIFTEDGRYVRRVVPSRAGGVAVAPGGQLDIQQHLNSTIPEERKDTSPGDVNESLQDALSGASAEHSAQDHVPGHSTDDGAERPSLPTMESVAGKTDGLLQNPMYIGNVLHQNPMYAPNAAQPRADGVTIINKYVLFNSENENKDLQQKTIVFRLKCEESSDCSEVSSVAVSPCNEIFLADTYNRQVQVFSMTGVYLRRFPTVTSGENSETLKPHDISIDGEGHVWVVGNADRMSGFIVRYTKLGSHLTTLRATFSNNSFSGMTVDTPRNLVVATEYWWGYGEVKLLHFNGTVEHKFRVQQGSGYPGLVALGREGNMFVSDSMGDARVHVYNNRSQYLYSFGCDDIDEGQAEIDEVTGICTDGSGNVLLVRIGGAVDMFTEDGRYVRRVVPSRAGGVAVAPGGQLVVTDFDTSNITIFYQY